MCECIEYNDGRYQCTVCWDVDKHEAELDKKRIEALEAQVRELKALVEEAGPFMRGTIPEHEDCGCASCLWLVRARKAMNS